jgi:hypothetical protein
MDKKDGDGSALDYVKRAAQSLPNAAKKIFLVSHKCLKFYIIICFN